MVILARSPPDQSERERALDPQRSFIVQAPAGSGKTELLIQRYLRLLACVAEPEQVLTITFTRKAAGEVRNRVIAALGLAERGTEPSEPHGKRSFELAREVLRDERRQAWQLHRHPSRLGISTIDAINAWLAGRAPLSAASSALQTVTPAPERLYREAARATLALVGEPDGAAESVAALLRHLHNDAARLERLIVAMLPRRDQWLRHVAGAGVGEQRAALEAPLRELTEHVLGQAAACMDECFRAELTALLSYAGQQLRKAGGHANTRLWAGRSSFPAPLAEELPLWQAAADALLTREDRWRRTVGMQNGFPPGTEEKRRLERLLLDCREREALREHLVEVRVLPGGAYAHGQWLILHALLDVLRHAAAELRLVFAGQGETDFAEVAADGLKALGGNDAPSALGLTLDYRIQHVLVDEFQDTSLSQFDLLRQLTAGWEPDDGRTVFLVGDPMQSIYRFRQAEVGLFMRVREEGIGALRPEPLRLRANFRSHPEIIGWVNRTFSLTFPTRDDALIGAVSFAESLAINGAPSAVPVTDDARVRLHWLPAGDDDLEARRVAEIVDDSRVSGGRVCILVRSRAHAGRIITRLRESAIPFGAPELENMARAGVAQDLLALTRALSHPADRLAWIALLRAPWCGLSLVDLHALSLGPQVTIPEALEDMQRRRELSAAGAGAIARLVGVLKRAAATRCRRPLRDLVEGAWLDLGGPATTREDGELETAEAFLELLEVADRGGDCPDPAGLSEQMASRYGSLGSSDAGVQVMTMHKAKGLEFDTVIVPGLERTPLRAEPPLLLWHEMPFGDPPAGPVLAPLAATGADADPLYRYLLRLERRKQACELDRLLYVACTRAKARLHLLARLHVDRDLETGASRTRKPRSGSLLERVWPAVAGEAGEQAHRLPLAARDNSDVNRWVQPLIRRLPADWQPPLRSAPLRPVEQGKEADDACRIEYEWVSASARHVGAVVHHWLQLIADQGLGSFGPERLRELVPQFGRMLEQYGTEPRDLPAALGQVGEALRRTLSDPRGRWMLSSDHADAFSELRLTARDGSRFREIVIDRTFVTTEGVRWIIDYKTSTHEGGDLSAFLSVQADRHREQLRCYRDALAALACGPIRTALYFPLLGEFLEVAPDERSQAGWQKNSR
jgi:ATP-dependent exoDNAse (exonuclease V) beta subunit